MSKFFIPIDKSSIHKNPHGGQKVFQQYAGEEVVRDEQGRVIGKQIIFNTLHTLSPLPAYDYKYVPTEVECEECGAKFPHTELREDYDEWADCFLENVCPECGAADCCEVIFERFVNP